MIAARSGHALLVALTVVCWTAWAGPPYITDDPEPTPFKEFEIYLFASGSDAHDGSEAATGIDFNYGATPDLQLTMVVPVAYENPVGSDSASGLGNIELAAKYRFLHQDQIGWDVAIFPRYFVTSASSRVGDQHSALLLPVWVQRDLDPWSTFGGGGCVLQNGEDLKDFCLAGWAVTRNFAVPPPARPRARVPDCRYTRRAFFHGYGCGLALRHQRALPLPRLCGPDTAQRRRNEPLRLVRVTAAHVLKPTHRAHSSAAPAPLLS